MKRTLAIVLMLCMVLASVSGVLAEAAGKYVPGTYEGSAQGMKGQITVSVTVSEERIESVAIDAAKETLAIGNVAADLMSERIVAAQSLGVDTVTGATITSYAILTAAKSALQEAGADIAALSAPIEKAPLVQGEAETVDVVIVGAGISGIMASYELKKNYPDVSFITLEKLDIVGGSLPMAGGAMIAMHSKAHTESGKEAELSDVVDILEISMGHEANREYVEAIYGNADELMDRLIDQGVQFDLGNITPASRANNDRLHAIAAVGGGAGFTNYLNEIIEKDPFDLRMHSEATELIVEEGKVVGVKVRDTEKEYEIYADAVLLSTGGFASNRELLAKYIPTYVNSISRAGAGADGDGILLTEQFNPEIVGFSNAMGGSLRASPTTSKMSGTFMVSTEGKRLANENVANDMIAVMAEQNLPVYLLMDGKRADVETLEANAASGIVSKFETLEALADGLGIDKDNLLATVAAYNAAVAAGENPEFGLPVDVATTIDTAPYYAQRIFVTHFGTIPSVKVDNNMRLLNGEGNAVAGLYCSGELTEGNLYDNKYPGAGYGISYAAYSGPYAIRCMMEDKAD